MFGKIVGFFADILKQVIIKIITFGILIVFIILCVKYFLDVDILKIFGIS